MKRCISDFSPVLSRVRHEVIFLLIFHAEFIVKILLQKKSILVVPSRKKYVWDIFKALEIGKRIKVA